MGIAVVVVILLLLLGELCEKRITNGFSPWNDKVSVQNWKQSICIPFYDTRHLRCFILSPPPTYHGYIYICEFLLSGDVSCILGRERFIEPLWILIIRIRIFRRVPMTLSRIDDHLITTSSTSERLWEVTDTKWRDSSCNKRKVLFSEQANYKANVEELTGDRGWLCDKNNGKHGQGFLRMMTPINKLLSSNEWLLTIKGSLTNCNCRPFHSTTKPNEATT